MKQILVILYCIKKNKGTQDYGKQIENKIMIFIKDNSLEYNFFLLNTTYNINFQVIKSLVNNFKIKIKR